MKKKSENKKIAMIGHKRVPSREGGIEIVVEELSSRLVKRGYQVDIYNRYGHHVSGKEFDSLHQKKQREYKGAKLITIPTFQSSKLNAMVYSILATLRAVVMRYDCIHFHAEGPCAMIWLPHLLHIRTVATIHGLDWQRAKWGNFATKYLRFGEKMAAKYADEIIVLSEHVKEYFMDTYNREVKFIPNGIQRPEQKSDTEIRKKYGLEKDSYLLFLGRIVPEKGVHYLIEAYKAMNTSKRLVIAGGSSQASDYMDSVKQLASDDERILFTDFVQGEILQELYSNAYLYILPSDLEGMPLSLLEAMSYGNCCVVSDIPECTEVIEKHGVIFKQGDIVALREVLQNLCDNDACVRSYKETASDFICHKYNWDEVVDQTEQLYEKQECSYENIDCE